MFGKDKSSFLDKALLFGAGYITGHVAAQKETADPDAPPKKTMIQSAYDGTKAIHSWTTLAAYLLVFGPILCIQGLIVIFFWIPLLLFCVGALVWIAIFPFVSLFVLGPTGIGIGLCIIWCIGYYIIWKVIQEQLQAKRKSNLNKVTPASNAKVEPKTNTETTGGLLSALYKTNEDEDNEREEDGYY